MAVERARGSRQLPKTRLIPSSPGDGNLPARFVSRVCRAPDLRDIGHRLFWQTCLSGGMRRFPAARAHFKLLVKGMQATAVQRVALNNNHRTPKARPRSNRVRQVRPPDLAPGKLPLASLKEAASGASHECGVLLTYFRQGSVQRFGHFLC